MALTLDSFGDELKVAVVGASGAIGRAMVDLLASAPGVSAVYAFSRSGTVSSRAEGVTHLAIDLLDESSIDNAAASVPVPLDMVLVTTGILHTDGSHGPGVQPEKSIRDFRSDQFARVFAVNTTGPAMVARYFLPKLVKDRKSVFAVLSARVGSISDNRLGGWYAYRASKAALNMIVKNLAIETARKQRHAAVVALHPGTVDSGLSEPFQSRVPSGQLFSPEYAAGQLLSVLNGLTSKDSGGFYAWDGERIEF